MNKPSHSHSHRAAGHLQELVNELNAAAAKGLEIAPCAAAGAAQLALAVFILAKQEGSELQPFTLGHTPAGDAIVFSP